MSISVNQLINQFNTHSISTSTQTSLGKSALASRQPRVANTGVTPGNPNQKTKPAPPRKPDWLTVLKGASGKPAVPPKPAHRLQSKAVRTEVTRKPDALPVESGAPLSSKKINYLSKLEHKGDGCALFANDIRALVDYYSREDQITIQFNGFCKKVDPFDISDSALNSFLNEYTFGSFENIKYESYIFDDAVLDEVAEFISKERVRSLAGHYCMDKNFSAELAKIDGVKEVVEKTHLFTFDRDFSRKINYAEAIDELKTLTPEAGRDPAGYLYMGGRQLAMGHTEALIVDSQNTSCSVNTFYSVVPYADNMHYDFTRKGKEKNVVVYTSDVNKFINKSSVPKFYPQASKVECASLCLSVLRQYLKNGAAQWKEYTLKVDCPDGRKYLLPSPQVLRYSQSGGYPEMIAAMVDGRTANNDVSYNGKQYSVETLAGLLDKGATISTQQGDKLDQAGLDQFCARWKLAYDSSMAKRDKMTVELDGVQQNTYLRYTADQYGELSKKLREEMASHGLSISRDGDGPVIGPVPAGQML